MKKQYLSLLVLISVVPLLGGCWNQRELTDLAFVMALGIDKGEKKKYDVTYQIVEPSNVSSGQTGGGGGAQGPPIVTYKSSGNNLTEASSNVTKQIPREIYYAHANILVISEELAREGILDILDKLERDTEFRTTTTVVIAKDNRAEDLVSTLTNLDKIPSYKFIKTLESTESLLGENIKVTIDDLLSAITSSGKEPVISGFTLMGSPEKGTSQQNINMTRSQALILADDLAVFKNGKLVGWLGQNNSRGAVWLLGRMKATNVDFDWKGKKDAVSTISNLSDTKVTFTVKNGKITANINIETIISLSEINRAFEIKNPNEIQELEKKTSVQIKKEVESSIKSVQKLKADIFGFGEKIYRQHPKLWKKIKGDWNNRFAEMDYQIKVKTYYRESGIRDNPFWSDINQ